ncbi:MAG TPA: hypothetical protein VJH89_01445, partial [Patescibacteria group bacterium]|nr:hypothetical protein [Patescibacteria group bacterium]
MTITYGENFRPGEYSGFEKVGLHKMMQTVGTVAPKEERILVFSGSFFGAEDSVVSLTASMKFRPNGTEAIFEKDVQKNVGLLSSPVNIGITTPIEAADGDVIEYIVDYTNAGEQDFGNQRVVLTYPDGFIVTSVDPKPLEGDHVIFLGALRAGTQGQIRVRGTIHGARNNLARFHVAIGTTGGDEQFVTFGEKEVFTKIVSSPFFIAQTVNGVINYSAHAGENLHYEVTYRNDGDRALRDAIVEVKIASAVLDFSRLELQKGSYNNVSGAIVWKAVDVPQLAVVEPGQSGVVDFTIPVLDPPPVRTTDDKNFVVRSVATIDSPDISTPIDRNKIVASNGLDVRMTSKVLLDVLGFYKDKTMVNSGPVPPEVGKETTYTLQWSLTNYLNDLSDARIVSALPGHVRWKNLVVPEGAPIRFNERTNEIIWDLGTIPHGTGIVSEAPKVSFQVSITPTIDQKDDLLRLLEKSTFTAIDTFTGERLTVEAREKTTSL